jgi:hypothetical protein
MREKAAAELLGDDLPEAEVRVLARGRRGRREVPTVDRSLRHRGMIHGPHG